jgi:Ca2+-binding RTX toxin-like protein
MFGGTGADTFDFNTSLDSAKGSLRDVIRDFDRAEGDVIDLSGIDANTKKGGEQAFKFIGKQSFHDTPGELRFKGGKLFGDTDGDGSVDFEIGVAGVTKLSGDDLAI